MRKISALCFVLLFSNLQYVCPSISDSLFIANMLRESANLSFGSDGEKLLYFAGKFRDVPYRGGTLELSTEEKLVVRTDSLDCTTFVETVLALYIASGSPNVMRDGFRAFCKALQHIRYRNGEIDGYASRLHYFTDWVSDNSRKNILYEFTNEVEHETKCFSLDYMTAHYELYPLLKNGSCILEKMRDVEKRWVDYEMPYIPKACLSSGKTELGIENGDIIALVTSMDGLDVVHLGFAYWHGNQLHLAHASSVYGKVIFDKEPLYEYLKKRHKHIGIRVVRIKK